MHCHFPCIKNVLVGGTAKWLNWKKRAEEEGEQRQVSQ